MTEKQLREKIGKIQMGLTANGELYTLEQMPDELKQIMSEVQAYTDYKDRVIENIKTVANANIPAMWENPVTGKKVYNEAYTEGKVTEARIDELGMIPQTNWVKSRLADLTRQRDGEGSDG